MRKHFLGFILPPRRTRKAGAAKPAAEGLPEAGVAEPGSRALRLLATLSLKDLVTCDRVLRDGQLYAINQAYFCGFLIPTQSTLFPPITYDLSPITLALMLY